MRTILSASGGMYDNTEKAIAGHHIEVQLPSKERTRVSKRETGHSMFHDLGEHSPGSGHLKPSSSWYEQSSPARIWRTKSWGPRGAECLGIESRQHSTLSRYNDRSPYDPEASFSGRKNRLLCCLIDTSRRGACLFLRVLVKARRP